MQLFLTNSPNNPANFNRFFSKLPAMGHIGKQNFVKVDSYSQFMEIDFRNALNLFLNQNCWATFGGKGAGSQLTLDFGRKIERKKRVNNPHLPPEQQIHRGEFRLFLQSCAWRVDSPDSVMGGCMDDNSNDGPMVKTARMLEGSKVKEIALSAPGYDLTVIFENGLSLMIFCCMTGEEDDDNYTIFTPEAIYSVGPKSQLSLGS